MKQGPLFRLNSGAVLNENEIAAAFRRRLNSHGHAFQQAVLRHIQHLPPSPHGPPLRFQVAEFPVELHGDPMHVDFVLEFGDHYLIGECKRADPALATWCFAVTPYVRRESRAPYPVFSAPAVNPNAPAIVDDMPHRMNTPDLVYQLAAELRTGDKGDGHTAGRAAIDQAVTQVSRAAGGWIELLVAEKQRLLTQQPKLIVPAVFTTAKLFVTDADLSKADLHTGNLSALTVTPKTWVWFQVHLSRQLRPTLRITPLRDDPSPSGLLLHRHSRTVAIVNVDGIQHFLDTLCDEDFNVDRL